MILLFGSTGLLGGQVLKKILEKKYPIRLCLRGSSDWKDAPSHDLKRRGIETAIADVLDVKALHRAIEGCTAIINICGLMDPYDTDEMERLHVQAVKNVVKTAVEKGVQRFIHVSCLGAKADSESVYLRTKFQSEQLVKDADFYWTILRPSYLFGEYFPLLDVMMPLISFRPMLPVLGSGVNPVQPIWVDNVADCLIDCIYRKDTVSQTFDLAGPNTYNMSELMEVVREELGMGDDSGLNIGSSMVEKVSKLLNRVPNSPLNQEVMKLYMASSFTKNNAIGSVFQTELVPLEQLLPEIIDTFWN